MKRLAFAVLLLGLFAGCQPANIMSVMRASDHENPSMETRCEEVDMRSSSNMKQVFSKYDGWRVIYISEYTTSNKTGTSSAVCFERPKK